jgi:phosphoglycolate phosphatase-like HAD superfamily hydrolase
MKPIIIFDLDGTTVNSYHRVKEALKTGKFCLNTYITKCNTASLIRQDTLLPLAAYMQDLAARGEFFVIMTARHMSAPDHAYLQNNGLVNHKTVLLSRDTVHKSISALPDAEYKLWHLNQLKMHHKADQTYIMYDDIPAILDRLDQEANITMIDAVALNAELMQIKPSQYLQHVVSYNKLTAYHSNDLSLYGDHLVYDLSR